MKALQNAGFELRVGRWTPPCGGACDSGHTVWVTLRITIRVSIRDTARVRVS